MNCDAYHILITGYIDEELSEDELQRLKTHLNTCETCLQYLQRQEMMHTAFKRYSLIQEVPEVPKNFASKVTEQLQGILLEEQSVSFWEKLQQRSQSLVLNLVERWASSLKTRPFAWTVSMSCFLALFVGLLSFEVYQRSFQPVSMPRMAEAPESSPFVVDQNDSLVGVDPESLIRFEETGDFSAAPEFIEVADEDGQPIFHVAQNGAGTVEDYVYSHVIEVYQDRLVDDVMFVGYMQDVFIQ
jgi:hypothetical protein